MTSTQLWIPDQVRDDERREWRLTTPKLPSAAGQESAVLLNRAVPAFGALFDIVNFPRIAPEATKETASLHISVYLVALSPVAILPEDRA
jgi:hypothetical protein